MKSCDRRDADAGPERFHGIAGYVQASDQPFGTELQVVGPSVVQILLDSD
jgi:hypothetical protein